MNEHALSVSLRGKTVNFDANGLACLNDIWVASGRTKNQRPHDWLRLSSTSKLIEIVLEKVTGKSRNWTKSDYKSAFYVKAGVGSFADVRVALAYAEYLSPKLALEVKEVFLRYKAGDATLADDILERASAEAHEWAGRRAMGRSVRKGYTPILHAHGVDSPKDYALCTNATYQGLFDKSAKQMKAERGISGNLRDGLDLRELAFVMASEALSSERIEDEGDQGPMQCRIATRKSADAIRSAIDADRRSRSHSQGSLF